MSDEKITRLGQHLPLSKRRVVQSFGKTTQVTTAIGIIMGLADGVVGIYWPTSQRLQELSLDQAREIEDALRAARHGIERWQEHASGYDRILVQRSAGGVVRVTYRGRTRPMRLSQLRGSKWRDGSIHYNRHCQACKTSGHERLWVPIEEERSVGRAQREPGAEVCPACVDRLANAPTDIAPPGAAVSPITKETP